MFSSCSINFWDSHKNAFVNIIVILALYYGIVIYNLFYFYIIYFSYSITFSYLYYIADVIANQNIEYNILLNKITFALL